MSLWQILEFGRAFHLFDAINKKAFLLQFLHSLFRGLEVFPIDTVLTTQCSLVNLDIRRSSGNTTQIYSLYTESIARAENTSYII